MLTISFCRQVSKGEKKDCLSEWLSGNIGKAPRRILSHCCFGTVSDDSGNIEGTSVSELFGKMERSFLADAAFLFVLSRKYGKLLSVSLFLARSGSLLFFEDSASSDPRALGYFASSTPRTEKKVSLLGSALPR